MVWLRGILGIYADWKFFSRVGISTYARNWRWMLVKSLVGLILWTLYGLVESAFKNRSRLCVLNSSTISPDLGAGNFSMRLQGWYLGLIFRIKEIIISGISDSDNFSLVWLELSTYIGFDIVRGVISIINPYAVTELRLGLKLMSTQVEIWVLGCFIYEIRSGQKPFHMESPVEPAEAMADVARTLGKLPENWVLIPFNWCGQYGCGMELLPLSNTEGPAGGKKARRRFTIARRPVRKSRQHGSSLWLEYHPFLDFISWNVKHDRFNYGRPSSRTLVSLQSGLGMVDEVNDELFPDEHTHLNCIAGVKSHRGIGRPRNISS